MKSGAKYTAAEIVSELGYKPEEIIGKVRVRIGGLPVNRVDHLVVVQAGVEKLDVIVGTERTEVELEKAEKELFVSQDAKDALEMKGAKASEQARKMQEAKAQAQKQAEKKSE